MPRIETFYVVIKVEARVTNGDSKLEVGQVIQDESDYSITLDEDGVEIVDTDWVDIRDEYPH